MPANPKYLIKSPWQKFAKLSAGIFGGYFICSLIHINLSIWTASNEVLISAIFTFYAVWATFLILPYLFKNGWFAWLVYLGLIIILYGLYHFGNQTNPFI